MKTWQQKLGLILAAQLLLAMAVFAVNKNGASNQSAQPLMDQPSSAIDKLVFSDANSSATLTKSGSQWLLPDLFQLPAEQAKVDAVLAHLGDTKLTWPVATTASSHERFEVDAKKFQRHIQAYQGDKLVADIYLGTSPGFKKIHLRRAKDDDVFAVDMSQYDFAVKASDWLPKDLLNAKDISQVTGGDFTLVRKAADASQAVKNLAANSMKPPAADSWSFANLNLQEGQMAPQVDAAKAQALANSFAQLNLQDAVTTKPQGASLNFSVNTPAGNWQYEFIKADKDYYVKRSDRDIYFKINQYDYDKFAKQNLAALTVKEAAPVAANAASSSSAASVPQPTIPATAQAKDKSHKTK